MSGTVAQLLGTFKTGAPHEQARAGHQIYQLESMGGDAFKTDMKIVDALVEQGAIPLAIELMDRGAPTVQEAAALILRPICGDLPQNRQAVLAAGVLPPLLKMLSSGPVQGVAHYAAGLIVNLSSGGEGIPEKIRELGAVPFLLQIIQEPSAACFGKYQAMDALACLAFYDEETARAALETPGLAHLLVTAVLSDPETADIAVKAVCFLGRTREWAVDILLRNGTVPALVHAFNTTDDRQLSHAVHALKQMATTNEAARPAIVEAGGLGAIFGVLEKYEEPVNTCVKACAAKTVFWVGKQADLREPIHKALAEFVKAVSSKTSSPVRAEAVIALQGLHCLLDGQAMSTFFVAPLVQAGALPVLTSAGVAGRRADVRALAVQILHSLASSGDQQSARDALSRIDSGSALVAMMQSTDSTERERGAVLASELCTPDDRKAEPWWADPPNVIRPADVTARQLLDAGAMPVCLQMMGNPAESASVRCAAAITVSGICGYRAWGQLAMLHAQGIPATIALVLRPDTPPKLRQCCVYLVKNAIMKNEHATWAFIQAGGPVAFFQAYELTEKGDLLQPTIKGLVSTLYSAWEISSTRAHLFPALRAFLHRIETSKGEPWERRDRLFLALFSVVDPDLNTLEASLQDALIQAGAFTLLIPMLGAPVAAAQVWAAKVLRGLVIANHATKRTLNNQRGLKPLFEALNGGNPDVQEAVLNCLGEELYQAGELSALAVREMDATKLLSQCVVYGETRVQETAMWVIGRMAEQTVTGRLMVEKKPRRLMSLLIEKAKTTTSQPTTQFFAVYALEFLSAGKRENLDRALKDGLVPVLLDIAKSAAAKDATRVHALHTLISNSRAYNPFQSKCIRKGIMRVTKQVKDDPAASPAVREAAADAYKELWILKAEGLLACLFPCTPASVNHGMAQYQLQG